MHMHTVHAIYELPPRQPHLQTSNRIASMIQQQQQQHTKSYHDNSKASTKQQYVVGFIGDKESAETTAAGTNAA